MTEQEKPSVDLYLDRHLAIALDIRHPDFPEQTLFVRRGRETASFQGKWSLPSANVPDFTYPGMDPRDTALRIIEENIGAKVELVKTLSTSGKWEKRGDHITHMIVFEARLKKGQRIDIKKQEKDEVKKIEKTQNMMHLNGVVIIV